jgi:hypothetical protein
MLAAFLTIGTAGWAVASESYTSNVPDVSDVTPTTGDCTTIDDITEQTLDYHYTGVSSAIPVRNAGEGLTFYDEVYDNHNKVIGHALGMVLGVYTRPADGHLVAQYHEIVELPGGSISTSGLADRTGIFLGHPTHFAAVGVSGKYLGMKGYRSWWLTDFPPSLDSRATVKIVLCR